MSDVEFDPDRIRRLGRAVAEPLRAGVIAAQNQASGAAGMRLPRFLADAESSVNAMLRRVPGSLSMLDEMASMFQERMYDTADAYERTEQANTTASGEITREL